MFSWGFHQPSPRPPTPERERERERGVDAPLPRWQLAGNQRTSVPTFRHTTTEREKERSSKAIKKRERGDRDGGDAMVTAAARAVSASAADPLAGW